MYSKNLVTSLPNLPSNYITDSLVSSTKNFLREKSSGQNYFSWSQLIKMFLIRVFYRRNYPSSFRTGKTHSFDLCWLIAWNHKFTSLYCMQSLCGIQLRHFSPVWDTQNNDIKYAKLEEANHIYNFFVGFNLKFDTVCGRILRWKPLPSLMGVCSEVRLEGKKQSSPRR